MNLTNLTKIALGATKNNLVTFVDFVTTEGSYITFDITSFNDWKELELTYEVKNNLKGKLINQIIFASNQQTSSSLTLDYIGFDISHMEPRVALDEGMQTEYRSWCTHKA